MIKLSKFSFHLFKSTSKSKFLSKTKTKFPSKYSFCEIIFETPEEKELRYEDELFFFNKEWQKLTDDKLEKKQDYFSNHLSEHQEHEANIILERLLQFSKLEEQYFIHSFNDKLKKSTGTKFGKPNIYDRRSYPDMKNRDMNNNPNWGTTQEVLSVLTPFIASGYFTAGASMPAVGVNAADGAVGEAKKEEKSEEKAEVSVSILIYLYINIIFIFILIYFVNRNLGMI